jgi:hypothetical protein
MKKSFKNIVLSSLLLASAVVADDTKSLVGFEGGFSQVDVSSSSTTLPYDETSSLVNGAFKIGAENRNYRLLISGSYYDSSDFKSASAIGAELQYLINFADSANFFVGVGVGQFDAQIKDRSNITRKFSEMYYGGNAGFNFHLGESFDLELGARVMDVQADNVIGGVTYSIDPIISAYGSLIFKFELER